MAGGQDQEQEPAGRKHKSALQKCFSKLKCYKKYKYLFFQSAFVYTYK